MQPQSPNPDFDFMLKNNPPPKRSLSLPAMSKPVKIVVFAIIGVILLVVISSVLSGHKGGGTKSIISAVAREQEIQRVTAEAQQLNLQDPGTAALAATVTSTLSSQQAQLTAYLAQNHTKLSKLQLAADTDMSADSQLQSASQNNQLDAAYKSYLKHALTLYQADLEAAYKAVGPNGKFLLKDAFDSTATLLNNAPLKS